MTMTAKQTAIFDEDDDFYFDDTPVVSKAAARKIALLTKKINTLNHKIENTNMDFDALCAAHDKVAAWARKLERIECGDE